MNAAPLRNPQFDRQPTAGSAVDIAAFMGSVYRWMALGLVLTGVVAGWVVASPEVQLAIFRSPLFFGLIIAQLVMVWLFSRSIRKVSFGTAAAMFITYCAVSGLTFAIYFLIYTRESVAIALYVTGGMFAVMSAYGTLTKKDLSSWGNLLFMGLIGIIFAAVVNLFFHSSALSMLISAISVVVFTALTAYDTQKIRTLAAAGDRRLALIGALELYLDFINLFIALLRLFGRRR